MPLFASLTPEPGVPRPHRPGEPAAPVPTEVAPIIVPAGKRDRLQPLLGLAVLCACFETGEYIKASCHLVLPGNILGLFLLLALMGTGAVPLHWVESAARWLLWLLPLLFVPLFVVALRDHAFWQVQGSRVGGAIGLATVVLWAVAGHSAQWLLRRTARRTAAAP